MNKSKNFYGKQYANDFGPGDMVSWFPMGAKEHQYGLIREIFVENFAGDGERPAYVARILLADGLAQKIHLCHLKLVNRANRNKGKVQGT